MSDDTFDRLAAGKTVRKRIQTTIKDLDSISPERWSAFINALEAGASWQAAAGVLNVSPTTVKAWMERGKGARSGPYRRFYAQVVQALQMATAVAEAKVKDRNPEKWLRDGPGRHVNDEWRDDGTSNEVEVNVQGQVGGGMLQIAPVDIIAALKELKSANVNLDHLTRDQAALTGAVLAREEFNADGSPVDDDDEEDGESSVGTNYTENGRWTSHNTQLPPLLAEPLARAGITPTAKPKPPVDLSKLTLAERLARLSLSTPKKTS